MITFVVGDLTRQAVDAIVNAANESLAPGGGVVRRDPPGGRHFDCGGCRRLGGCATGDAKATGAGDLPARWVIHAVGPVWQGGDVGEAELLASAYTTGRWRLPRSWARGPWPFRHCRAASTATRPSWPRRSPCGRSHLGADAFDEVRFVFLDEELRAVFARAAEELGATWTKNVLTCSARC